MITELAKTPEGLRRLAEHEQRTNTLIEGALRRSDESRPLDAPVAQGEHVDDDGQAGTSSGLIPPSFIDLAPRMEPTTVAAAGKHQRPAASAAAPQAEQLAPVDEKFERLLEDGLDDADDDHRLDAPASPSDRDRDEDMATGIVGDDECELRDIVMLHQVEER